MLWKSASQNQNLDTLKSQVIVNYSQAKMALRFALQSVSDRFETSQNEEIQ